MDIIAKLNQLRSVKKISVYKLSELSGINQSTLANTFSRGVIPSISNLEAMCKSLGTNLSLFFSENDAIDSFTDDEISLIDNYRKLSSDNQTSVSNIVQTLAK